MLEHTRSYSDVIDYPLLACQRHGESKYGIFGKVQEVNDFAPPTAERLTDPKTIGDEAFGRDPTAGGKNV